MRRTSILAAAGLVASTCWVVVGSTSPAQAAFETGTVLPPGPTGATPSRLAFAGHDVWATWTTSGVSTLYRAADDGTGDWQVVDDPETGQPVTGTMRSWDGLILSFQTDPANTRCTIVHVASADGVWQTPGGSCLSSPTVGVGAKLIRFFDDSTPHHTFVFRAADGSAVDGYDASGSPAMVGTWVWSAQGGELVGHDASGVSPDRQVPLPPDCLGLPGPRSLSALTTGDPWALTDCADADLVVPLTGQQAALRLPITDRASSLGNGFTYGPVFEGAQSGIVVRDLSAQLVSHVYGPAGPVVASDEGAPRIAWIEGATVSVAHLDWLGRAATPADDTTPPSIDSTDGSPAAVRVDTPPVNLSFSWTGTDNWAGPLAYDVEVGGVGANHAFRPYRHTYDTSVGLEVFGAGAVCFRVRATDRVGNESAWSAPRCTLLDGARPEIRDGRADTWSQAHILRTTTRAEVTNRVHATDDTGVTSYDVQQRLARPGADFGPWTSPTAWQGITAGAVTRSLAPGAEVCFRSRARDAAGRTSPWGDRHCFVVPYDDAAFVAHGRTSHLSVAGAMDGTVTRLADFRASLTRGPFAGRSIAVRERVYRHSVSCLEVIWGGAYLPHCGVGPEGPNFAWMWSSSFRPHPGRVRIDGLIGQRTDIDAIAVIR